MDLLLQAAKVLEQENSDGSPDRVTARSTRGSSLQPHSRERGESQSDKYDYSVNKNLPSLPDDNNGSADDEALSGSERRRAGGAGTREVHNQLEKNRRKQMRECFNYLQQCIPSLENKRVATQSILQGAIKHIKSLKKKNVEQEKEIQMLAKRKSELKRKHDVEFNKCTEEEQRLAEVMLKVRKPEVAQVPQDDDGHTSDSTTTASEGPGTEDYLSEEEKILERDKAYLSRVNPVVAAKLDGFRKRKLASLDSHPKSTDCLISSMKESGLLSASPVSKSRTSSMSSVSSSSLALKNMLEQKKNLQNNQYTPASALPVSSLPVIDKSKLPVGQSSHGKAPPASASLKSCGSSLISSHPMISNQLAALPSSAPAVIPPLPSIHKELASSDQSTVNSLLQFRGDSTPFAVRSHGVSEKVKICTPDKTEMAHRQNSVIYAPAFSSLNTTAITEHAATLQNSRIQLNSGSYSVASDASSKPKIEVFIPKTSLPSSALPGDALKNSTFEPKAPDEVGVSDSNLSAISVIQAPSTATSASGGKIIPSIITMSLLRGLPLNSGLMTLAPTTIPQASSSDLEAAISATLGGITSMIPQKIGQTLGSEILLTSPLKSSHPNNPSELTSSINHVTALLGPSLASPMPGGASVLKPPSTFLPSQPAGPTNLSSTIPQASLSLQDTLKTMAIAPALLPFTVTSGQLPTSATQTISPVTPALRFYTPLSSNSVVGATPLTNGQTASLMPTVMRLGVLQNLIPAHVQVQSPQMIAQPIVMVTNPNTIINRGEVTATIPSQPVNGTQPSASSSSVL